MPTKRRVTSRKLPATTRPPVKLDFGPPLYPPILETIAKSEKRDCVCWLNLAGHWENEACPLHRRLRHQDPRDSDHGTRCSCPACEEVRDYNARRGIA